MDLGESKTFLHILMHIQNIVQKQFDMYVFDPIEHEQLGHLDKIFFRSKKGDVLHNNTKLKYWDLFVVNLTNFYYTNDTVIFIKQVRVYLSKNGICIKGSHPRGTLIHVWGTKIHS